MIILLVFAFIAGLVTILAPCVWPLLPIILSSTSTGEKRKPLGVTLGIITTFALFTLTISYIVKIIPFDPNILRLFAVIVIGLLGLILVIPKLSQVVEGWVSRLSSSVGNKARGAQDEGFKGGFILGSALGIVWTPCAGPILATIATLAATRSLNIETILVSLVYVIGVGIPLFFFALGGRWIFTKTRFLSKHTGRVQQIFGIVMIITAIGIFTNYDKILQAKLLDTFPRISSFVKLESNKEIKQQLDLLKKKSDEMKKDIPKINLQQNNLPNLGKAPEFVGIYKWLNTDKPLTLASLRGKVILVDFWTYTCINCIRTLPFVTSWYDKYKDKGFVVIGVHTPEFEFEKKTENVESAISQYKIHYPVAQDNNYETWNAYSNQYWPAEYLIDAQGNLRRTHFGEGEYDQTEMAIQKLLAEKGSQVNGSLSNIQDQTPTTSLTPETYLGQARMERFASNEQPSGGTQTFTANTPPQHYFSYKGTWDVEKEYAVSTTNSSLDFHFYSNKVFLVITPESSTDIVQVSLDGKSLDSTNAGADMQNGKISIDQPRLYNLIDLKGKAGDHILHLEFKTKGTKVYAFTFG